MGGTWHGGLLFQSEDYGKVVLVSAAGHDGEANAIQHAEEGNMNQDTWEGKWKQLKGTVRQQWGKLTDDDIDYMSGSKDRFVGRLQERYGIAKDEAQRQADNWLRAQKATEEETTHRTGGGSSY